MYFYQNNAHSVKMKREQDYINEIFDRLVSGDITPSEKLKLKEYIQSTFKDERLDELMQNHWENTSSDLKEKDKLVLQSVKLTLLKQIKQSAVKENIVKFWTKVPGINYMIRIAAILAIPVLLYTGYQFFSAKNQPSVVTEQQKTEIIATKPGERINFNLPDGTKVWLSAESKLTYLAGFAGQKLRLVTLEGRGFFEVKPDVKHPFIVEAGKLKIKVLGTSFDVCAYSGDAQLISTLAEGKISVLDSANKELAFLTPGEQLTIDKQTENFTIKKVDLNLMTSWKDGYLIFDDAPLSEVAKSLERWFDCKITVDTGLKSSDFLFNATIKDETITEVLQMLEISTSLTVKADGRNIYIASK